MELTFLPGRQNLEHEYLLGVSQISEVQSVYEAEYPQGPVQVAVAVYGGSFYSAGLDRKAIK